MCERYWRRDCSCVSSQYRNLPLQGRLTQAEAAVCLADPRVLESCQTQMMVLQVHATIVRIVINVKCLSVLHRYIALGTDLACAGSRPRNAV